MNHSVNIVFIYPKDNSCQTDIIELNSEDYLYLIEELNNSGCKYTQKYLDENKVCYIYFEELPNSDVTIIISYAFSVRKNNDIFENYDDHDDDYDHDDHNEELDDRDCLESGTGQWAHN